MLSVGYERSLFVDGSWSEGRARVDVVHKYTRKPFASVSLAGPENVASAAESAKRAVEHAPLAPSERYAFLKDLAGLVREHRDALASTLSIETGKPLAEAKSETERCAYVLELSAEEARNLGGEAVPINAAKGLENRVAFTLRTPVGVVAAITPFNAPLVLLAHKLGPAIAGGNAVLVKPALETPCATIELFRLIERTGLPTGYVHLLQGGADVGNAMVTDPRVDLVSFTGSARAGSEILRNAGLKRVLLELGNNSAAIVAPDVDLDEVSSIVCRQSFGYAGQVCISLQRTYVHRSIAERFIELLANKTRSLVVGDPSLPETNVGPMLREADAERVERWVDDAIAGGARLVCGGRRNGATYEPTILTDVQPAMKVVCEEIFGPVVSVIPFDDYRDVVDAVNAGPYGLQAGIFTSNIDLAFELARKLRMGAIMVNDGPLFRADAMPYGGIKSSGLGREGPKYLVREMTHERLIILNLKQPSGF